MPLSRYEIRSEYSLANPDLYRVADKDDPEGLLEGVAMAGLVGIIRQLGDLAEFAAEVFHDLHEDVLATAARGHVLLMRVRQLETEVPLIEDIMLTKNNHGNPMYDPGLEWHPHIHNEQNHFTQGDLPRFIRSAYEDCRSPPRLFPLDRYDAAGAGACLKRFSDPSFFKMEWASSELMKAEKEQRDQKARRMKKKGRQQGNRDVREARLASQIHLRAQTELENEETLSIASSTSDLSLDFNQEAADLLKQESDDMLSASGFFSHEQEGQQSKVMPAKDFRVKELALESLDLETELSTLDTLGHMNVDVLNEVGLGEVDVVAYDSASETDNFMDAVTTMDSEVETDSEAKARGFMDAVTTMDSEVETDSEVKARGLMDASEVETDSEVKARGLMDAVTTMDSEVETDSEVKARGLMDASEVETDSEVKARGLMDAVTTMDSEVETDSEVKARGFMDAVTTMDSEVETDSEVKARGFMDAVTTMDSEVETDLEVKARGFMDTVTTMDSEVETDSEVMARSFMDAVPTMDSGVETESEVMARGEVDDEFLVELEEVEALVPLNLPPSEHSRGADEENIVIEEDKEHLIIEEDKEPLFIEVDTSSEDRTPEEAFKTEHTLCIDTAPIICAEEEDSCFVDGNVVGTPGQDNDASTPNGRSGALLFRLGEDGVAKSEQYFVEKAPTNDSNVVGTSEQDNNASTPKSRNGAPLFGLWEDGIGKPEWYSVDKAPTNDGNVVETSGQDYDASTANSQSGASLFGLGEHGVAKAEWDFVDKASTPNSRIGALGEDGVAKSEEDGVATSERYYVDKASTDFAEELDSSFVDKSVVAPSIQDDDVSTSINQRGALSPGLEDAVSYSEGCLQSGSINVVLQTPEILEANTNDKVFVEKLPANFNQLPDVPEKDLPHSRSPMALGALTTRKRWQISNHFNKECLASDLEGNSPQASEGEQTESPKKLSSHSSPSASLQPMSWALDLSRSHHTDDEMDGMQISSASSSCSSTVSTPRPSTLATTLLNMSLESKPRPPLSPQKLGDSSPRSLLRSSSGIDIAPSQPVSLVKTTAEPLISPDSECSAHSSPHSSSSTVERFFDSLPDSGLDANTPTSENLAENFSAQSLAVKTLEIFPPPPPLPPLAWRMTRSLSNLVFPSKPRETPRSISIPHDVGVLPDELLQGSTSSSTVPTVPRASVIKPDELIQACNSPMAAQPTVQKFESMPEESLQPLTHATGPSDLQTSYGSFCEPPQVFVKPDDLTQACNSPMAVQPTAQKIETMPEESLQSFTHATGPDLQTSYGSFREPPQVSKPSGSHKSTLPSFTSNADTVEQGTVSVLAPLDLKRDNLVTAIPDRTLQEKFIVGSTHVFSPQVLRTESTPARLDESRLRLQTRSAGEYGRQDSPSALAPNFERRNCFAEGTTSHDRLKKRSKWAWTSSTASSDDREVLLEQIRTRSFNLRQTSAEKPAAPRPVTNINVAAILEKANAIRQAFAGSDEDDEDDEWSDA